MKNKADFTIEDKIEWLSGYMGYEIKKSPIQSPENFSMEVEQDFNALYTT